MIHLFDDFFPHEKHYLGVELEVFSGRFLVQKKGKYRILFVLVPLDAHKIFRKEKRLFYFRQRTIFSRITPTFSHKFLQYSTSFEVTYTIYLSIFKYLVIVFIIL